MIAALPLRPGSRLWDTLTQRRLLMIFLDFDGTLAPLAPTPRAARLPEATRVIVRRLARAPGCRVVVISGRALKDLRAQVNVPGIVYAGNHGLEIQGPGMRWQYPLPVAYRRLQGQVRRDLAARVRPIPGVLIEDKGLTFSIHYRLVRPRDQATVRRAVLSVVRQPMARGEIRLTSGKKVIEIRPAVAWHKGTAVRWLMDKQRCIPGSRQAYAVYIGDDRTDEDAFRAVGSAGLTIRVGRSRASAASYALKTPAAVRAFLKCVYTLRKGG